MRRMIKITAFLLAVTLLFCMMPGCSGNQTDEKTITITDMRGRTVTVPENPERIVCIGASALRLYCYIGDMSLLAGVEDFENGERMKTRPYAFAYSDIFAELPSAGAGGPMSSADAEAIAALEPDLVFSLYDSAEEMDDLQKKTNVPVVCLSYGGADPFGEKFAESLRIMGRILSREERAEELINYIAVNLSELQKRTEKLTSPSVYLACNTYNGGKGSFADTMVKFCCFAAVGADNIIKNSSTGNNPTVDIEAVAAADPEFIFVDAANAAMLESEYAGRRELFDSIRAFRENKVFCIMPFNQYYTNMETALADCWYVGTVLYPDEFSDIDMEGKFNEICSFFLQKDMNCYSMAKIYCPDGFTSLVFE